MPPAGFKPANDWPQTLALDRSTTKLSRVCVFNGLLDLILICPNTTKFCLLIFQNYMFWPVIGYLQVFYEYTEVDTYELLRGFKIKILKF